MAIVLLPHCMWLLQACEAKPDKSVKKVMLWSADKIMELIFYLQSAYIPSCLWSCDTTMQSQSFSELFASTASHLKCISHEQGVHVDSYAAAVTSEKQPMHGVREQIENASKCSCAVWFCQSTCEIPNPQRRHNLHRGITAHVCMHRQGWYLWRYARNKLTASLLMWGHAWPLSEALDNHPLVNSMHQLHRGYHKQLVNMQDTDTDTESSGSDLPESAEGQTTEADNEGEPKGLCCAKCHQKIPQVCFSCTLWHSCSLHSCKDNWYVLQDRKHCTQMLPYVALAEAVILFCVVGWHNNLSWWPSLHVCATRSIMISADFPGLLQDVPEAKFSCGNCHASFYCSKHCQTKDAPSHKAVCMRNKLRLKLASKSGQQNEWINTSSANWVVKNGKTASKQMHVVACIHVCTIPHVTKWHACSAAICRPKPV